MAAFSFSQSGATPQQGYLGGGTNPPSPFGIGSTPQSKALAGALQPSGQYVVPRSPTPPAIPSPSTPVKKTTVNNLDGSSHVTEYHAPAPTPGLLTDPAGGGGHAIIPSSSTSPGLLPPQSSTPPQNSSTAPTVPPQSNPTTFPGLIGSAASAAQGNIPIGKSAADIAAKYGEQIADVGRQGASAVAGDLSTGTNVVGAGNAAIASQSASQRMSALAAGETAALQGTSQQLTAQNQAQSGLNTTAGLIEPSASFPFVFNPATGTFSTPGTGGATSTSTGGPTLTYDPQKDSQSLAQSVMNHQISYNDAIKALSYGSNGSNAAGQLSSAILSAGGNPTVLQTQSDIQQTQETQFQTYQSAHQQASLLQNQLTDLIKTFGLNPNDLNLANAGLQVIASTMSDPRYKILNNYLADVASRYSQILTPPGGSATDTTRSVAQGMLDGVASGQSIINVMQALDQQAEAVSTGVKTIGSNNENAGSSGGGITTHAADGSTYNFVQDANGNWVAK